MYKEGHAPSAVPELNCKHPEGPNPNGRHMVSARDARSSLEGVRREQDSRNKTVATVRCGRQQAGHQDRMVPSLPSSLISICVKNPLRYASNPPVVTPGV